MTYNEELGFRIREILANKKVQFDEKNMMGGLIFMVDEKMFCGIHYDKKKETDLLMARIGEDAYPEALKRKGSHAMDFTGRPMKGYVFVGPTGHASDDDLGYWLQLCLDFNPLANRSKKRKKKKLSSKQSVEINKRAKRCQILLDVSGTSGQLASRKQFH